MAEEWKNGRFYVYALVDPRDGAPFYVGKGTGRRSNAHVREWRSGNFMNEDKCLRIDEIHAAGFSVEERMLAVGLTEPEAFDMERKTIAEIGLSSLTNIARGESSTIERSKVWAALLLARIKPYDVWVAELPRPAGHVALYRRIVEEFRVIAEHGCATVAYVHNGRVEFS